MTTNPFSPLAAAKAGAWFSALNSRFRGNDRKWLDVGAILGLALMLLAAPVRLATAEVNEIRIGKQYGLPYIQFVIMEDRKLIEKHARLQGLGDIKVDWAT